MPHTPLTSVPGELDQPGEASDPTHTDPNPLYAEVTARLTSLLHGQRKSLHRRLRRVGRRKKKVVAAHQQARHAGGRQRQAAQAAGVARQRAMAHDTVGGIDHGRRMPRWLALLITLVCVFLLWQIDSTLLTVLLLPLAVTRLITLVIVMASAAAAHVAGKIHRREHECDVPELELAARERLTGRAAVVFGITIEVTLALIRAVKAGALFTSIVLVAAGLALWTAVAWVAFRSHADLIDDVDRAEKGLDKQTRHATADVGAADKALTGYWASREDLRHFAATVVARCTSFIEKSRGLWAREHPDQAVPSFAEPSIFATWRRFADGEVPSAFELGALSSPVLYVPDEPDTRLPGVLGLPSGEVA